MRFYSQKKTVGIFTILVLIAIIANNCGERDRLNPFDPSGNINPDTLHFEVKAGPDSVILEWDAFRSPDLTGYNLYRALVPGELERIAQVSESQTRYTDDEVETGKTYVYRMSALGEQDETALTSPDSVIIGNSWWWVLSDNPRQVSQLSHDGFHVYNTFNQLISPRYITLGFNDALVFTYDFAGGSIYYFYPNGNLGLLTNGVFSVGQIVYNNINNNLLATSSVENVVTLFDFPRGGQDENEVPAEDPVTAAGVSPGGTYYLAAKDSLFYFNGFSMQVYYVTNGASISVIEPYGTEGLLLATDSSNEIQLVIPDRDDERTGILDTTLSVTGVPQQIVYNSGDNSIWIRTYISDDDSYSIFRYANDEIRQLLSGIPEILSMDVNSLSNECLAASYATNMVYRIDVSGTVRQKKLSLGRIFEIVAQEVSG